jgi:hypothetical protein
LRKSLRLKLMALGPLVFRGEERRSAGVRAGAAVDEGLTPSVSR